MCVFKTKQNNEKKSFEKEISIGNNIQIFLFIFKLLSFEEKENLYKKSKRQLIRNFYFH